MTERLNELKKKYHEALQGLEDKLFTKIQARLAIQEASIAAPEEVVEKVKETVREKVRITTAHRVRRGEFRITQGEATTDEAEQQSHVRWQRWVYSVVVVAILIAVATLIWFF